MGKVVFVDSHISGHIEHFLKMKDQFAEAGHELLLETCKNKEDVIKAARNADAIITTFTPIDREIMENIPSLKVVLRNAIGYEIIDIEAASELGIAACNIPDYSTEEVATHTFALLLACERKLKVSAKIVESGNWKVQCGYPVHRLSNQTLGLIGFGRIARCVCRYAQAFGMNVVTFDPYLTQEVFDEFRVKKVGFEELCKLSDAISVNAPLTKENYHMINKNTIASMKDGIILVNTGRGALIATSDLVEGIKLGKIKAAGLDVLEEEPLRNPSSEILQFDNVIVTSHIAYDSVESVDDNYSKVVFTITQILDGTLTYNALNKEAINRG
jgi:Lactate dehydrogenase and related dehydrogenases